MKRAEEKAAYLEKRRLAELTVYYMDEEGGYQSMVIDVGAGYSLEEVKTCW